MQCVVATQEQHSTDTSHNIMLLPREGRRGRVCGNEHARRALKLKEVLMNEIYLKQTKQ